MELFYDLNWSRKTSRPPAQQFDFYNFNISDDETDIFYNHLNEIDLIHKTIDNCELSAYNEIDIPIDPRTRKLIENLTIDCRGPTSKHRVKFFDRYPSKSKLKPNEHAACISAILKFQSTDCLSPPTPKDRIDQELYFTLTGIRCSEKEKFDVFVKQYFNAHLIDRYKSVDSLFLSFIRRKREQVIKNLQESNANNVAFVLQSSLPNDRFTETQVAVKFVKYLQRNGAIKCLSLPKSDPFVHCLKICDNKLSRSLETQNFTLHNDPIIQDSLNINQDVDFVCTVSSLYCLINTSLDSWATRVFVRLAGNGHKIVTVEKPLPKTHTNSIECSQVGHKWALKEFLHDRSRYGSWSCETETLIDDNLVENIPECLNVEEDVDWVLQECDEYMKNFGNLTSNTPNITHNVSYGLWQMTGGDADSIKLMIRTKQDGFLKIDNHPEFINLSTKLEFKTEFGAELMTLNQLIKEWCHLKFHPDTVTHRFRIDATTSRIISKKKVTISDVERELKQGHGITNMTLLQNLWTKLDILRKFPSGEYVLRKDPTTASGNISIYRRVDTPTTPETSQNMFNLHDHLMSATKTSNDCDSMLLQNFDQFYCPIDENEVTPLHKQAMVMPCAFPHWLKHKRNLIDDKSKFNRKQNTKRCDKQTAIVTKQLEKKRRQRMAKQKRRNEVRKKKAENIATQKIYDDEYDMATEPIEFDAQGNVRIMDFGQQNKIELAHFDPCPVEPSTSSTFCSVNADEYAKQANLSVSDLESSPTRPNHCIQIANELCPSPNVGDGNKIFGLPTNVSETKTDDEHMGQGKKIESSGIRTVGKKTGKSVSKISKLRQILRLPKLDKSYV